MPDRTPPAGGGGLRAAWGGTCAVGVLSVAGLVLLVVLAGGVAQAHALLLGRGRRNEDGGAVLEGRGHAGHAGVVGQSCEGSSLNTCSELRHLVYLKHK